MALRSEMYTFDGRAMFDIFHPATAHCLCLLFSPQIRKDKLEQNPPGGAVSLSNGAEAAYCQMSAVQTDLKQPGKSF